MTSYVMCNKKKLGIKKSDIAFLEKSIGDRKLEYFKRELLKILDKKEKEEEGENEVSKAFIVQDLYKSMTDPFYMAKGGKVGVVGEIRTWNGKKYKKMPNKKWVRVYDKETRGAKLSIAALRRKIDACTNSQELLNLVLANKDRFCDELGRPLPIVQELSEYASKKNNKLEKRKSAAYKNETEFDKKVINTWANKDVFDEAYNLSPESVKLKAKAKSMKKAAKTKAEKKAADAIMEDAKKISKEAIYEKYSNEPFKIGTIANYLKVLFPKAKDYGIYCGKAHFVDHIVNHHPEMPLEEYQNLNKIVSSKSDIYEDTKNGSIAFAKQDNNKLTVVALKEDDNGKIVFWKTNYKTGSKLTNKFKKISLGDYSTKAKNRIETATSQISQSEQNSDSAIKPVIHGRSDNSNIAQDYNDVNKKDEKSERAAVVKKHIEDKLNEYMNDSYTKSSAYGFVKKYGKARLEKIAEGTIKSDEEYKKWLNDKIADIEKERGENVSDYTIDTAIWKHCVAFYEREAAREKLKSMDANEKEPDLPVDEKDMQEAKNIIGADVKRILDGRDTYGNTKQTLTDKIKRRIRNNPGVARAMLVYIKQEQEKTGKKVYTEKHSIWEELPKLNENAKEALKNGETETKTGVSGNLYEGEDGTTVVENKDWGRYQISFPGKPDSETISMLKHNGFRWSPKTQTWVCFNTSNGEYSLKRVAEKLGLKKTGDVQKSFTARISELKKSFFDNIGA